MLKIDSPPLIFNRQKAFRISDNVEKTSLSGDVSNLIIYSHDTEELPSELKKTLEKLITACGFESQRTRFINQKYTPVSFSQLKVKTILIFGNITLGNNLPQFKKNIAYEIGGVRILRTETLENLEERKGEKANLWTALKKMLNIQ